MNAHDLQHEIHSNLSKVKPQKHDNEENKLHKVFDNFVPLKRSCVEINKYDADTQWNNFYSGQNLINN
jgi:hypothetical protein